MHQSLIESQVESTDVKQDQSVPQPKDTLTLLPVMQDEAAAYATVLRLCAQMGG